MRDRQKRFTTPFQRSITPNPTTTPNATATPTTPAASTPTYNTVDRSNFGYQRRGGYRGEASSAMIKEEKTEEDEDPLG
ncbi:MAG: hypothetical protein EZS28_028320 [Streblomastix strix]|uniref:Uncharacterized protein n=1 Tax=Streblomastix strix TaxID=222440 RepID=A0A5J4V0X0_9EUKA|nr:MAG: hypothetical protein EZS28_028320 [Streblomastix strix]